MSINTARAYYAKVTLHFFVIHDSHISHYDHSAVTWSEK